jgi:hypothetical protein
MSAGRKSDRAYAHERLLYSCKAEIIRYIAGICDLTYAQSFGSKISLKLNNGSYSIFKAPFTYSLVYLRYLIWCHTQVGRKIRSHVAGSSICFDTGNRVEWKCSVFQTQITGPLSGWSSPMIEWYHEVLQLRTGQF